MPVDLRKKESHDPAPNRTIRTASNQRVFRLGLAAYPGQDPACVPAARELGVNLFFYYDLSCKSYLARLRELARDNRDAILIAAGSEARLASDMERDLRMMCDRLRVGTIDLFLALYVSPTEADRGVFGKNGALDTLRTWRDAGRIRYTGASVHDRGLAVKLVRDGRVDVLMHRYNAAHRKAEREVFPEAMRAGVPVIAFTATRWTSLLQGHEAWSGPAPEAADCYRFCATHPAVHCVLCAPLRVDELKQDAAAMRNVRMGRRERHRLEQYGDLIYGTGADSFETDWP